MRSEKGSICEQHKTAIKNEVVETAIEGVSQAIISLVPFVGELINSTLPNIYSASKKSQFNDFIQSLNKSLKDQQFSEDKFTELTRKLDDPETYKYLSTIIDSVFFSKSNRARAILGIITANYFSSESGLSTVSRTDFIRYGIS